MVPSGPHLTLKTETNQKEHKNNNTRKQGKVRCGAKKKKKQTKMKKDG